MCYRRIEVFDGTNWRGLCIQQHAGTELFASKMMLNAGVYVLWMQCDDPNHRSLLRYFFTKQGWKSVGKHILARIKKKGFTYRVVHKKRWEMPHQKDELQAILPVSISDYIKLPFKESEAHV